MADDDVTSFLDRMSNLWSERGLDRADQAVELCVVDGREIEIPIFKGSGFCCIDCRKKAGDDVSSVGTIMFVTTYERIKIMRGRNKRRKIGTEKYRGRA